MNKCLKITFKNDYPEDFLHNFVQKHARALGLEGLAQEMTAEQKAVIIVCGPKDDIELFVDQLHKGNKEVQLQTLEVEPFLKTKDYRGVFRVIE